MKTGLFKPDDLVRYTSPDGKCIVQGTIPPYSLSNNNDWPDKDGLVEIDIAGEGINTDWVVVTDPRYITFIKRVDP